MTISLNDVYDIHNYIYDYIVANLPDYYEADKLVDTLDSITEIANRGFESYETVFNMQYDLYREIKEINISIRNHYYQERRQYEKDIRCSRN